MTEWHINDLSIDGQFHDSEALRAALEPLLITRVRHKLLRDRLYCSRLLAQRPASAGMALIHLVGRCPQAFRAQALVWLANSGPFWDDDRQTNPDDYFEHREFDVTDQGLGEAARRRIGGRDAQTFSFNGGPMNFAETPLDVDHGLREDRIGRVPVPNCWSADELGRVVESIRPSATSWRDLRQQIAEAFPELIFSEEIEGQLRAHPFSRGIADRVLELLRVLQQLVRETGENDALSLAGVELLNNHFVGEKGWFSDESDGNKVKFKAEMTFKDPADGSVRIFCPWHGKIKISQFRIHFEWPRPPGQKAIKVVYIGPKITRS